MTPKTMIAILLIALGVVAFAYQGITYTRMGKGVDIGPIHVAKETTHHIPLPPILGGIALVGGILLLVVSGKRVEQALSR